MTYEESKEKTQNKFGYIGVGNAGSQIGIAVHDAGVKCVFINTSTKDLDQSIIPADIEQYLVADKASGGTGRGAGHNRDTAKKLWRSTGTDNEVINSSSFSSFMNENDVIIVGASTGGGTGSGITPTLVYQLKDKWPSKVIILLGILPRVSNAAAPQYNTASFCNEVNELNKNGAGIPYMLYDLEKYKGVSDDEAYKKLAITVRKSIEVLAGSRSRISTHGMIDERDLLTIIAEPGLMNIYYMDDIDLSKIPEGTGIQDIMEKTIKSFPTIAMQKDHVVKYFGLYMHLPEDIEDPVRESDFSKLNSILGNPWDTYINLSITEKPKGDFALIASGLSYPFDRISIAMDAVKQYADNKREKEFDLTEDLAAFKVLSKNENIDKILKSAQSTTAEDRDHKTAIPSILDTDWD